MISRFDFGVASILSTFIPDNSIQTFVEIQECRLRKVFEVKTENL